MKIIYSGGWNNKSGESIQLAFMYAYQATIRDAISKGKKIAMVTLAKENGFYDFLINPLYGKSVEVIDTTSQSIKWNTYDGIFLAGGSTSVLKKRLLEKDFSLSNLKKEVVLLGDSAGAYVLGSYFFISPSGEQRGIEVTFAEGFNPPAKLIVVAHKNNPIYCNEVLISKVRAFAQEKGIQVLILNENEQKILENNTFSEVDKNTLFNP